MKKIIPQDLARILKNHKQWLRSDGKEGTRADLIKTDLSGTDLSEANLMLAELSGSQLSGSNLLLVDLSQANLSDADLSGADLSGADLLLTNFERADLSRADLSVVDLSGATLSHARLAGAILIQADLSGATLKGADLSGADLSGANLSSADLAGANLSQARLPKANLQGANLTGANLLLANTYAAEFKGADLTRLTVDSLTMTQFSPDLIHRFQRTFQVINLDYSSQFSLLRQMDFPPAYQLAGLSFLNYFSAFLVQKFPEENIKVRIEMRAQTVTLILETPNEAAKNKTEEFLEIFGLVIQGKLIPEALSDNPLEIERLKQLFRHSENILKGEHRALQSESDAGSSEPALDIGWLRDYVGGRFQHMEHIESRTLGPGDLRGNVAAYASGFRKFMGFIKTLMGQHEEIRPELTVLFEKLSLESPRGTDIGKVKKSLSAIKSKSPKRHKELSALFSDLSFNESGSPWGETLSDLFHRGR